MRSETARLCAGVIFLRFRSLAFGAVGFVLPPVNAVMAASIRPNSASNLARWFLSFAMIASIIGGPFHTWHRTVTGVPHCLSDEHIPSARRDAVLTADTTPAEQFMPVT